MNILLFSGSLRKDSLNKKLLKVAETILISEKNLKINLVDIKSLNIPVYDGDVEAQGIPNGVITQAPLLMLDLKNDSSN